MYELIEHRKLDSAAASITFSNIPQTYTDLYLVLSTRVTSSYGDAGVILQVKFNDSTTNFSGRSLYGTGSSVASYSPSQAAGATTANQVTANTFGSITITIPNYAGSNSKSYSVDSVVENNATASFQEIYAGLWSDSAAITKIELYKSGTNLAQYSSASLYGVGRNTPRGNPKAVGGTISYANGHWVHTFTGSGTFYANEDLDIDALVVAGGGGSGNGYATPMPGGGGAGGLIYSSNQISVQRNASLIMIVGAGGVGGTNSTGVGGKGSDTFLIYSGGSLQAYGGGGGSGHSPSIAYPIATSGGSGGGELAISSASRGGAAGTSGQGNAGGDGYGAGASYAGGGGGGAGGAGGNANVGAAGNGGVGLAYSITGTMTYYAGGGGANGTTSNGTGGLGGGGSANDTGASADGAANTGGGAGGRSTYTVREGASGGSGIVIVRYRAD